MGEALAVARGIEDAWFRSKALGELAPRLAERACSTLHLLWCGALPILAARTREDLLLDIRGLSPVIATLGGAEALNEIARAIQDVARWWP